MKKGIISAILVGNEKKIKEIAAKLNLDLTNATIFNEENDALAVKRAVKFVRDKEADILMKGNVTSELSLEESWIRNRACGNRKYFHIFSIFEVPTYHKLIALT